MNEMYHSMFKICLNKISEYQQNQIHAEQKDEPMSCQKTMAVLQNELYSTLYSNITINIQQHCVMFNHDIMVLNHVQTNQCYILFFFFLT